MSSYYYLVSSLPILFFHHGVPPLDHKSFIDDCKRLMTAGDFAKLSLASLNSDHFHDNITVLFTEWQKYDFALRNELVQMRAKNLDIDPTQFIHPFFSNPSVAVAIKNNINDFNPLQDELHLMELQWNFLDNLQVQHYFDLDFLIVYSLKLLILERKASFDFANGKSRFIKIIKGNY